MPLIRPPETESLFILGETGILGLHKFTLKMRFMLLSLLTKSESSIAFFLGLTYFKLFRRTNFVLFQCTSLKKIEICVAYFNTVNL